MSNDNKGRINFNESTGPSGNNGTIRGLGTTKITKGHFSESSGPLGKQGNSTKKQGK